MDIRVNDEVNSKIRHEATMTASFDVRTSVDELTDFEIQQVRIELILSFDTYPRATDPDLPSTRLL